RGLQSTQTMSEFSSKKIEFVARAKENRKYEELSSLINSNTDCDLGSLTLLKDSKVYLYTGKPIQNKKGNLHYREEIVQTPLRLIMTESKNNREYKMAFITNNFDLTAKEITDIYKKRWDIEVFFRFIKQELNVSHLVSLNENGIKVMLYMTLIAAMLILVYKHTNNLSYKTAKRRFKMEVRNLLIREIVILSGGNPNIHFKT
ncbi:transposase, partial [Lacihabitans sp. CCS-44]|uniref:transposase n=1 Tax=Lacihabitans sp. CCS-44 TaxID=2487331 RepID=UPI0020CE463E